MAKLNNVMEIFSLLDKSNCRKCNEKTCLAFAGAVFQGRKKLGDCPLLPADVIERYQEKEQVQPAGMRDLEAMLSRVKQTIAGMDLGEVAQRLGGTFRDGRLTLKLLGKDFTIDAKGDIFTDIHVHGWILGPVFSYITRGKGLSPVGQWIPYRELPGGKSRYRLFEQRCEKALKHIADTYTDLFEDMMHLFNGRKVHNHYESDLSLVLSPLPKVPILICYWKPDDGLESDLHVFFDSTAEDNLGIEAVYPWRRPGGHVREAVHAAWRGITFKALPGDVCDCIHQIITQPKTGWSCFMKGDIDARPDFRTHSYQSA